jgi:hypothetical protein
MSTCMSLQYKYTSNTATKHIPALQQLRQFIVSQHQQPVNDQHATNTLLTSSVSNLH